MTYLFRKTIYYHKVKQNFSVSFYHRGSSEVNFDLRWHCETNDTQTNGWDCSGCACVRTNTAYNPGIDLPVDYAGNISTTFSGKTCLPWQEISHPARDQIEIFKPLECEHNYCRNPGESHRFWNRAWCYVWEPATYDEDWIYEPGYMKMEHCKYIGNSWNYI